MERTAEERFVSELDAAVDKLVKQRGRDTVALNAERDPDCVGYARVPGPDACDFCVTMGAANDFYHTEKTAGGGDAHGTADDGYHAWCNCQVVAVFDRGGRRVARDAATGEVVPYDGAEMVRRYEEAGRPTYRSAGKGKRAKGDADQERYREPRDLVSSGSAYASLRYANNGEKLYRYAAKIEPVAEFEDVVVHCDGLFFEFRNLDADTDRLVRKTVVNVNEFARMLKENPGYHGGDIRLFACSAGKYKDGAAQLLADQLGVRIKAPIDDVIVYDDGSFIVEVKGIPDDLLRTKEFQESCWKVFEPGE